MGECGWSDSGATTRHILPRHRPAYVDGDTKLDRSDAVLLWLLLGAVLFIWLFVFVADLVEDQHTQQFDEQVIRALRDPKDPSRPVGPRRGRGLRRSPPTSRDPRRPLV